MATVDIATANHLSTRDLPIPVRAYFLGQSLALDACGEDRHTSQSPLILPREQGGYSVLFDYGAVVLFGLSDAAVADCLAELAPHVRAPFDQPKTEAALIQITPTNTGKVQDGVILMAVLDLPRLQLVAEVMAKSVVLDHYEVGAAAVFDRIEPYAEGLQHQQQDRYQAKQLLRQIGQTLLIQHKIVGRVEIVDKPELLWEYPDLDAFYLRLEDEYEIRERHLALERKLDLVSRTAETVLELQRQETGLRLEFYVVMLIVVEVLISLYDLFFHTH
jgi:uncharacterized Rmd1/YagE family protein